MNNLQIFKNEEFGQVRTLIINNEPWFVGKDIATVLGYANASKAISAHCKHIRKEMIAHSQNGKMVKTQTSLINEGDLYRLIISSKLPNADKFENWVFDEVLPTIRKHGAYMTDNVLEQAIGNPDFMIGLLTELKSEQQKRKELEEVNKRLFDENEENKPKVDWYEKFLNAKGTYNSTQVAKLIGEPSAKTLNKKLNSLKIIYSQGKKSKRWFPYISTPNDWYFMRATEFGTQLRWTTKGVVEISKLLGKTMLDKDIEEVMTTEE